MSILYSILFSAILSIAGIPVFAQQKKIDSLEKRLLSWQSKGPGETDTNKAKLLNALAWEMSNYKVRLDTAMIYARKALAISEKAKWNRGRVESWSSIGRVFKYKNDYARSVENYLQAVKIARELNEKGWTAKGLNFIGQVYREQGNYPLALDYLLQSLRLNEETGNKTELARDLSYIGMVYTEIDDMQNALEYYQQALKKNEEIKDKYWIAINLQSIATIYKNENNHPKALEYYARVLERMKGNVYSSYLLFIDIADVYNSQLGLNYPSQQDTIWEKAMAYYSRALATATELKNPYAIGMASNGIGALYLKKNKLKEAEDLLTRSEKLLVLSNRPDPLKNVYYNISLLDSMKGDWKNSLAYFKLYATINDSLFNRKKSRQLTQLQIRYETDKKQEEIKVLNKDNELKSLRIQQQSKNILLIIAVAVILLLSIGGFAYYRSKRIKQEALKQISEAKLASLKSLMDKHFIFSSLHSIDTFLMNNDAEAASDYLVKYSKLIRSILEMSYQPEVSLEEEIALCRSYLELEKIRFNHAFAFEFSIDGNISLQQTQFPSMLLQPLVENAVKHGIGSLTEEDTGRKGLISISINRIKDKIVCSVTDNGRGLQFSGLASKTHRSYSGKGIIERVRVYNTLRKNKASFLLKDNNPGVTAVLTLPFIFRKQSVAV